MARILLLEDNLELSEAIVLALQRAGYEVLSAADGQSGQNLLTENQFDLVISDIVMPGADGLEVLFSLRKKTPTLPVIAMSGGGRLPAEVYLRFAESGGACSTLRKPFRLAELVDLVRAKLPPPATSP